MLDIGGTLKLRKLNEKIKEVYDKYKLHSVLGPNCTEKEITENKHNFIR